MNEEGHANIDIDVPFAQRMREVAGPKVPGGEYEVGTYQPAVVVLDADFQLLFSWSSVPNASNIGGAIGRPRAGEVWKAVSTSLGGDMSLVHQVPPSTLKAGLSVPVPLFKPLFFALLMANGNFLKPKFFVFDESGKGDISKMMKTAVIKLGVTVVPVACLLAKVPQSRAPIAVALATWLAYLRVQYGHMVPEFKEDTADAVAPLPPSAKL